MGYPLYKVVHLNACTWKSNTELVANDQTMVHKSNQCIFMEIKKASLTCCQKVLPLVTCKVELLYNSQFCFPQSHQLRWWGGGRHYSGLLYLSNP